MLDQQVADRALAKQQELRLKMDDEISAIREHQSQEREEKKKEMDSKLNLRNMFA